MHRWLVVVALTCVITASGCGKETVVENAESTESVIGWEESTETLDSVELLDAAGMKKNDVLPIIQKPGSVVGTMRIKQVEHLGISDWFNQKAVDAGVKDSYSITLAIDVSQSVKSYSNYKLTVEPTLVSNDQVIGEPCCVGWSGFPTEFEILEGDSKEWIEVGVQPLVRKLPKNTSLVLKISDSNGKEYQDVIIDKSFLKGVVEGPSLKRLKDESVVELINGATFSFTFDNLLLEKHQHSSDNSNSNWGMYYDFEKTIKYLKGPSNKREVALVDNFHGNRLSTDFLIGVQGSSDPEVLYKRNSKALRFMYEDSIEVFPYVNSKGVVLEENGYVTLIDNRSLPASTTLTPEYLRLWAEFPEEAKERSNKEMLKFSGRYLVYQGGFSTRELERKFNQ